MAKSFTTAQENFLRSRNVNSGRRFVGLIYKPIDLGIGEGTSRVVSYNQDSSHKNDSFEDLTGSENSISLYKNFLKLLKTDKKAAKQIINDNTKNIWKEQQLKGEYQNPLLLSYAVTAEIMGLPKEQCALEKHINDSIKTDLDRFYKENYEFGRISELVQKSMYEEGGFLFAGGPAPQKTEQISEPETTLVKYAERKLLKLKPEIRTVKRRFGRKRNDLVNFNYDKEIGDVLAKGGKNANEEFYKACRNIEKSNASEEAKLRVKLIRELFQKEENYHPNRKKAILGGLAVLAASAAVAGVYATIQNNRPPQAPDEEGNYARSKGLSDDLISKIKKGDDNNTLDPGEKAMINYLATIDAHHQQQVVDAVYKDDILSADEVDNMTFLSHLPKDQANTIIEGGNAANCDLDGDGINNLPEQIFSTPWDVYNPRYALLFNTDNGPSEIDTMQKFLINEQKFLPENIIKLTSTNATKANFESAISNLSEKIDKNGILVACLKGYAYPDSYIFNDGNGRNEGGITMSYKNMDSLFDTINSNKTLITIFACYAENAPQYLKDGPSPRVVADISPHWFFNVSKNYDRFGNAPTPDVFDINKDGYVTVGESLKTASEYQVASESGVTIEDNSKIADSFILGSYKISD